MDTPITVPQIRSGVYRIRSAARVNPELYLERQVDKSILGVQLNPSFSAQLWSITPIDDGAYTIACMRDFSPVIANTASETADEKRNTKNLWTIETRGNTFVIGNVGCSLVLSIDERDILQTCERSNAREQRWNLHLVGYNNVPIAASTYNGVPISSAIIEPLPYNFAKNGLCVEDPEFCLDETLVPPGDYKLMVQFMQRMLEPFCATCPRPALTSEVATSKLKGDDGRSTMESLMQSIRDKDEEINQLRNRTTQLELETETLTVLLKEKDKKIEKLQNNTARALEALTQVLQEKGKELMELQQKTTKTAYETETLLRHRLHEKDEEVNRPPRIFKHHSRPADVFALIKQPNCIPFLSPSSGTQHEPNKRLGYCDVKNGRHGSNRVRPLITRC